MRSSADGSERSAPTKPNMGPEIFTPSDDDDDDDDDDAVEDAGATGARGVKKKSAGATDKAPPAAKAGFAFGEETVKAAVELDSAKYDGGGGNAVKDDGDGDNAGAGALSEQSHPASGRGGT